MSARRSSGVQRARGGRIWRWPPTIAISDPRASRSRLIVCHSPPFSVAFQKHCGVKWAWTSMLRMGLLSVAAGRPPRPGAASLYAHPAYAHPAGPRPARRPRAAMAHRVLVEKDVPMRTRDGVTLRADVYRPDATGRFPVLLSRLPYDKNQRRRPGDIDPFVERGYVVIMQDTRGRFASEGDEYYPLIWEAADGYHAVEWAAELPYSNGRVGTMGQSYLGATQYLLAPTRPPHLLASFPASAPADFHQCWAYHTG